MWQFGGRMIGCAMVGLLAGLFLIGGGEEMTIPRMMRSLGGTPLNVLMMVLSALALYVCLRLLLHYAAQVRQGSMTAPATLTEYSYHEDSDGDATTTWSFRTDDGHALTFTRIPWRAYRDHELDEALKHEGTRVILDWYPESEECRAIRLLQPWTQADAPSSDDAREDAEATLDADMIAAVRAAAAEGARSAAYTDAEKEAIASAARHRFAAARVASIVALVAIAITVTGLVLMARIPDAVGLQLIIGKMTGGIAAFAAAAIVLIMLLVSQTTLRRRADENGENGTDDGEGYDGTGVVGVDLRRGLALLLTLFAVGGACIRNPATAIVEGPHTETIVTTSDINGFKVGSGYEFLMFQQTGGGFGDRITVAVPVSQSQAVKDEILRITGGQKDRQLQLTYWPGGSMKTFDHVAPAKNDPTVE
ncbi:hypothetical protein G1C96_0574 [Bifidobacterium sp. DSM 109958]|uniref:Uncharacterized protein n=1 Tax=Bifidobacterium moraviense TaxID=2675323 RepID=A0A7Y0F0W7_9BIFI|nr:hypothetical protein [Bifidobacterium sp. DSM 109958]NMM99996.1 hypothetical protein [Bifidobacterium sp. DSM 109958]